MTLINMIKEIETIASGECKCIVNEDDSAICFSCMAGSFLNDLADEVRDFLIKEIK